MDGRDAPEAAGRVATAAMTGAAPRFGSGVSQSVKGEDDDDDASVTRGGPHLAVGGGRRAVGGRRGR
jgi:hypothetical protein